MRVANSSGVANMSLENYLGFLLVSLVIIIVPGPNVTLIVATAALKGIRAGLVALLGTTAAQCLQLVFVGAGMTWLVHQFSDAFNVLRYIGAAYLVWLGIKAWRTAHEPLPPPERAFQTFRKAFLVGLSNPKSLTFFAAFFPQFISLDSPAAPQVALLATSYMLLAFVCDGAYAIVGGMGNRFFVSARSRLVLGRASGSVLIAGGALMAGLRGK